MSLPRSSWSIIPADIVSRLETWQTILRKQYYRRNPELNPIGPEPDVTPASDDDEEGSPPPGSHTSNDVTNGAPSPHGTTPDPAEVEMSNEASVHEEDAGPPTDSPAQDSRDWLDLTMMEKLSSMHLVVEWQFQNPTRLRNIMKDDDEDAFWVCAIHLSERLRLNDAFSG